MTARRYVRAFTRAAWNCACARAYYVHAYVAQSYVLWSKSTHGSDPMHGLPQVYLHRSQAGTRRSDAWQYVRAFPNWAAVHACACAVRNSTHCRLCYSARPLLATAHTLRSVRPCMGALHACTQARPPSESMHSRNARACPMDRRQPGLHARRACAYLVHIYMLTSCTVDFVFRVS